MSEEKKTTEEQADPKVRIPEEVKESAQKIWLAGLGALSAAEQEGSKLFKTLVEKGEKFEGRGKTAYEDAKEDMEDAVSGAKEKAETAWDKIEDRLDEVVSGAFKRFGVPSREEIATLTLRVEELTKVVEELKPAAPAKKAAPRAKSTAAKTTAAGN